MLNKLLLVYQGLPLLLVALSQVREPIKMKLNVLRSAFGLLNLLLNHLIPLQLMVSFSLLELFGHYVFYMVLSLYLLQ